MPHLESVNNLSLGASDRNSLHQKGPGPRRTPARPPAGAFLVKHQDIAYGVVALVQVVDLAEAGVRLVLGDAELVGGFGRAPVVGRGVLDAVLDPDGHLQLRGSTYWAVVLSSPATVSCATARAAHGRRAGGTPRGRAGPPPGGRCCRRRPPPSPAPRPARRPPARRPPQRS